LGLAAAIMAAALGLSGCAAVQAIGGPKPPSAPPAEQTAAVAPPPVETPAPTPVDPVSARFGGDPLVVIRFSDAATAYERSLYYAVSTALERRPQARFALVSVSPPGTSAADIRARQKEAQAHLERVLTSMSNMGLRAERLKLTSTTDASVTGTEVRVYPY
jgi:hypothetical protein